MRVLHVNKFLYRRGGAESYMLDVARLQQQAGDVVEFFGMDHPDNDLCRFARHFPSYVEFEPAPTSLSRRAALAGRMMWSRAAQQGIARVVDEFQPDVVHCHNIYHQLSPSVLRPLAKRGVPVVLTLHDYKLACPTYQMLDHGRVCDACVGGRFHRAALQRCKDDSLAASAVAAFEVWTHSVLKAYSPVKAFICPSHFMLDVMNRAGVYPERLRWIPHFVTPSDEHTAPKRNTFAFLGRLSYEKGVDTLIQAVALAGKDVSLEIAGAGPAEGDLEALARDIAPGQVTFHGRLDRASAAALMTEVMAVVVPSRWNENQPMVVLEAMSCGRPVIASRIGGIPELIEDGKDGHLIPPDDPRCLAGVLKDLLADPDRAEGMGSAARAKVTDAFSPGKHLDQLVQTYHDAA